MRSGAARSLAASVIAVSALAAAAPSAAAPTVTRKDALEGAVVQRINTIRATRGLARLAVRSRLETAGARHARNMARNGYFSHSWSNGAAFGTWIQWFWPGPGYGSWSAGENLYWRPRMRPRAASSPRGWVAPASRNILRASWRVGWLSARSV